MSSVIRTQSSPLPPLPPQPPFALPAPPVAPARLPDEDRTAAQIGGKVAEVLWGYYGQQGVSGTPLTQAPAPIAPSPVYDDAYADTLIEERPPGVAPVARITPVVVPAPVRPAPPKFQVYERLRPAVAAAVMPITAPVPLPVAAPAPAAAPMSPAQRPYVVQLGFVDGTTMDLSRDHPAAKALRAAADALTLRAASSH